MLGLYISRMIFFHVIFELRSSLHNQAFYTLCDAVRTSHLYFCTGRMLGLYISRMIFFHVIFELRSSLHNQAFYTLCDAVRNIPLLHTSLLLFLSVSTSLSCFVSTSVVHITPPFCLAWPTCLPFSVPLHWAKMAQNGFQQKRQNLFLGSLTK